MSMNLHEYTKKPLKDSYFGPFGMGSETRKDAYLVISGCGGPTRVEHQYGCVGCYQFNEEGCLVFPIRNRLGGQLNRMSGCVPDENGLRVLLGDEFLSAEEGLIRVRSGWILTSNCD